MRRIARKILNTVYTIRDTIFAALWGTRLSQFIPAAQFSRAEDCIKEEPAQSPRNKGKEGEDADAAILIALPCKNVKRFLPTLMKNLSSLDYPKERIYLAFSEGDSTDGTYESLTQLLPQLRQQFAGAQLYKKDFNFTVSPSRARWRRGLQRQRRAVIAKARNHLLNEALQSKHQWVLWVDADLIYWPPDIIRSLLSHRKDIIVPHCTDEKGMTFDLNSFKYTDDKKRNWRSYIKDGLIQPPVGFGRKYLADFKEYDLVSLDGVGATMLLINADIHRRGLCYPEEPYHLHIETEGLAFMARSMGSECWGAPGLSIIHPRY